MTASPSAWSLREGWKEAVLNDAKKSHLKKLSYEMWLDIPQAETVTPKAVGVLWWSTITWCESVCQVAQS